MNVTRKQKEMLLVIMIKKFEYSAGKSVAKFLESYGIGKTCYSIILVLDCSKNIFILIKKFPELSPGDVLSQLI